MTREQIIDYSNLNPIVMVSGDWQKRAITAEAENQRLRSALEKIREHAYIFAEIEIEDMVDDALKEATP